MTKVKLLLSFLLCFVCVNGVSQVMFNGKRAAVDNLTGTWLLTIPKNVFGTDFHSSITFEDGVTDCQIDGVEVDEEYIFSNVMPGATYHLQALHDSDTIQADIQFTYWPVIQIYGNYAKTPYYRGTVVYSHPDSIEVDNISARVRWAGSSTAEPDRNKHNFHLKFYNEDGSKKNMSFFGLRSDFHWRLDAGQVDFARVRNRVAKDIWADFAKPPYYASYEPKTPYNYVRGDFVEVFLNDEYMGIYSLNEHMDRQQLKLKKYDYETGEFHGGLWKPMSKTNVTLFCSLPTITNNKKTWDKFYVKYPNIDDVNPTNFNTLYNAVKFTMYASETTFRDSAEYYFDVPVMRDYYLFTLLLQAPDNIGKNIYYACYDVATDKRLTVAVWDLDCTQGQFWSNQSNYYHHTQVSPEYDLKNNKLVAHNVLRRLWLSDPSFHGLATERYWELRASTFNPDSILARYEGYFNEMKNCGADKREIARWSYGSDLGGRELNFDDELIYLRNWWNRHIAYLDENVFIPYQMGDVDFDHNVSVRDVAMLINYLLEEDSKITINHVRADVNGDGMVDVGDLSGLITMLLIAC